MASAARPATSAVKAFASIPGLFKSGSKLILNENQNDDEIHQSDDKHHQSDGCRATSVASCWLLSTGWVSQIEHWWLDILDPNYWFPLTISFGDDVHKHYL